MAKNPKVLPFNLANSLFVVAASAKMQLHRALAPAAMTRGVTLTNARPHVNLTCAELASAICDRLPFSEANVIASSETGNNSPVAASEIATEYGDLEHTPATAYANTCFGARINIRQPRDTPSGSFQITLAGTSIWGGTVSNQFRFAGIPGGGTAEIILLPTIDFNGIPSYAPLLYQVVNAAADVYPYFTTTGLAATASVHYQLLTRGQNDIEALANVFRRRNANVERAAVRGESAWKRALANGDLRVNAPSLDAADFLAGLELDDLTLADGSEPAASMVPDFAAYLEGGEGTSLV